MCIKVAIFLMLYTYNYLRIPCILAVYRQYVYNFSGRLGWSVINLLEGYGNDNSGADLTPEETERLAVYRRKKAGQQRARREGKKCDQPKRKVS